MNKYKVRYNGKEYFYNAESTTEAAEKFGARKCFGNPMIFGLTLEQYDADTRGVEWAKYHCNEGQSVLVERV